MQVEWMTYKEMADVLNVSVRTVKRRAADPEKHGLIVRKKDITEGGRSRVFLAFKPQKECTPRFRDVTKREKSKPEPGTCDDLFETFRTLLHKKLIGKTGDNRRQTRRYYTRIFKRTGAIPKALWHQDGRKVNGGKGGGRSPALTPEMENRFIEMVRASALSDPTDPAFMTRNLRKVVNYKRRLDKEFKADISRSALDRLVKKHKLKRYIERPDYDGEDAAKVVTYFNPVPVFDLIQMDGCTLKWLECRDSKGKYRQPIVVEFFDTGSRYMMALGAYDSESTVNSCDIFCKFLLSTPFPLQTIRVRPDNAGGFRNLKRPFHHLNRTYSMPDRFFLDGDFARVQAPKHKVHLESSHRALHNFEDWIIAEMTGRIIERRKATKFINGKYVTGTITRLDADIAELNAPGGLMEQYKNEHNDRVHQFSEEGKNRRWRPADKLKAFIDKMGEGITFGPADIEAVKIYGHRKLGPYTVQRNGVFTFEKRQWRAVGEEFKGAKTKVKISVIDEKLYLFDPVEDGLMLGEALPVAASEKPKFVERRAEKRMKANEFEMICKYLEECGMAVNPNRVLTLHDEGLTLKRAMEMYEAGRPRFEAAAEKYPERSGLLTFNLFVGDWMRIKQDETANVKPYADLGGV